MQIPFVKLLRRVLIGLIAVVCVAVLVNYTQTSRQRRSTVKLSPQILGPEMMRSAVNIEHIANSGGGTKFKLRAEKLLETRQGTETLQGIVANDFDREGNEANHLTSDTAKYDTVGKKLDFQGHVHITLGKDIDLRMETLHYDLKDQIYTSDDRVQLHSSKASGTVVGIRYDNAKKMLEAFHEIAMIVHRSAPTSDNPEQSEDYQLSSNSATYSEAEHEAHLVGAARVISSSGALGGDAITFKFSPDRRHLTGLSCDGQAEYESSDGAGTRTLRGRKMDFGINPATQALESIAVHQNASFATRSAGGEQTLEAAEIQLELDPAKGVPKVIRSQQGVRFAVTREGHGTALEGEWLEATFMTSTNALQNMEVRDHATMKMSGSASATDELSAQDIRITFRNSETRSMPKDLQAEGAVRWKSSGANTGGAAAQGRLLSASSLTMAYAASGDSLESGTASGGVTLSALAPGAPGSAPVQRMDCDRASFVFFPGNNRLKSLTGDGHVKVAYDKPPGAASAGTSPGKFTTSSTGLRAQFGEADGNAEIVSQTGDFSYDDGARTGRAGSCDFDASKDLLVMRDHPSIADANSSTTGDIVEYDRVKKLLTVHGHVRSILKSTKSSSAGFMTGSDSSDPGVVTADEMLYWPDANKVQYDGKAQLLSVSGQLQAQTLTIYNSGERVEAERDVRHLILGSPGAQAGKPPAKAAVPPAKSTTTPKAGTQTLISSSRLRYSRSENRVHYEGGVVLVSADTRVQTDQLDAFLDQEGKRIDHATAEGNVEITQPGRVAKGLAAQYFMAEGKFVVTGKPAMVHDLVKGGKSYALRLTFLTSDDSIVLDKR